jgi:hypothetical protein
MTAVRTSAICVLVLKDTCKRIASTSKHQKSKMARAMVSSAKALRIPRNTYLKTALHFVSASTHAHRFSHRRGEMASKARDNELHR